MLTVNGVLYDVLTNPITSREQINSVFAEMLAVSDLTKIAAAKEHFEKVDGIKTDVVTGMFLTYQGRLPGIQAATFDGTKFYTKHAAVKFDLFNLSESEFATSTKEATAKAATISGEDLKTRLARIAAENAAKPAASPAKTV
jgi:hypothetical protein